MSSIIMAQEDCALEESGRFRKGGAGDRGLLQRGLDGSTPSIGSTLARLATDTRYG
jgi:hypothetical protein